MEYSHNNNPNRQFCHLNIYLYDVSFIQGQLSREGRRACVTAFLSFYLLTPATTSIWVFGTPKSDTCTVCYASNKTAHTAHKQLAEQAFETQKQDRLLAQSSDDTFMITFDLQKTLPLPKLSTSIAFYLRQIWLYSLGIHLTCKDRSQQLIQFLEGSWRRSRLFRGSWNFAF